jgi:hypothetical protein
MRKKKCRLTPEIFKLLHDTCLEKVKDEQESKSKVSLRQLYGFGGEGEYDETKASLKKLIEEHPLTREKFGNNFIVNTKYFYNKLREMKRGSAVIVLDKFHAVIYFYFLGFEGVDDFVKSMYENGFLTKKQFEDQQGLLNKNNALGEGLGHFQCYHYSKLWHGIYSFELEIDFDSFDFHNPQRKIAKYDVRTISALHKLEHKPVISTGIAIHDSSNLIIDVADQEGISLKKMIFSVERGPDSISAGKVFLGAYLGISRNSDIISGTICMMKKNEGEDASEAPIEIKRYLYLDKWQKRIGLEPLGYDLTSIPLYRDSEDLLQDFVGNYRFCWLTSTGDRMIESQLIIEESYQFSIKTFMSKHGIYSGRIFIQNNIACLNSIGLRKDDAGKKASASVFFDLKHIPRREKKEFIVGTYNLAGVTNFPKFGYCILQKIDDAAILKPTIHNQDEIQKEKNRQKIYNELVTILKRTYDKSIHTQSVEDINFV